MSQIKAIQNEYKGYKCRSRMEARWAVYIEAMGIQWEYEPEGYTLEDGTLYLPDFWLNINRRMFPGEEKNRPGCFAEIKGFMTDVDAHKIILFSKKYPIMVLGNIPNSVDEWTEKYYITQDLSVPLYSYRLIDGDDYTAYFSDYEGELWITGADHEEWDLGNKMELALEKARQARFEHGETPN